MHEVVIIVIIFIVNIVIIITVQFLIRETLITEFASLNLSLATTSNPS